MTKAERKDLFALALEDPTPALTNAERSTSAIAEATPNRRSKSSSDGIVVAANESTKTTPTKR